MAERGALRTNGLKVSIGPNRIVDGAFGPLLHNPAEFVVTGVAEENVLVFAALPGNWAGPGDCLEDLGVWVAQAIIAELGQEGRGKDFPNPRQG